MNLYEHLDERDLQIERYPGLMVIEEADMVIFPLWNLNGKYLGYQQYQPLAPKNQNNHPRNNRYYTSLHGNRETKPIAVWGLESLDYRSDVLFVVEGIFDACRLHNYGLSCVAVLGAIDRKVNQWIATIQDRTIFKIEDVSGSKLGNYPNIPLPEGSSDVGDCNIEQLIDNIEMRGVTL